MQQLLVGQGSYVIVDVFSPNFTSFVANTCDRQLHCAPNVQDIRFHNGRYSIHSPWNNSF
jgi:hypothetical protein